MSALQGVLAGGAQRINEGVLPSIFDFLAQESLRASMKPGMGSALKLLMAYFPRLSGAARHFDELYLLFHLVLENHYLKKFSASFAENFYGIKRTLPSGQTFSRFGHRARSLIALVLFPYAVDKLQQFYDRLQVQGTRVHRGWRRLFLRLFPHLKAAFLFAALCFQIAYVFSVGRLPSPLLLFARCNIAKLSADDIARIDANGQLPLHMRKSGILARIWRLILAIPSTFGRVLSYALFMLQFLEYCYSDELGKRFGRVSLPSEKQVICMEVDKCPLCHRVRQNDTVCAVSGYVFCHSCIYNFVRVEGRCPVTSIPASTNELVKIYH